MLGHWLIKSVLEPQATARIAVDKLVESMRNSGSLQPIVLCPQKGIGYYLIAGHCRLAAARRLKWESIPAVVLTGLDADRALLAEIDENLIRNELSGRPRNNTTRITAAATRRWWWSTGSTEAHCGWRRSVTADVAIGHRVVFLERKPKAAGGDTVASPERHLPRLSGCCSSSGREPRCSYCLQIPGMLKAVQPPGYLTASYYRVPASAASSTAAETMRVAAARVLLRRRTLPIGNEYLGIPWACGHLP
jgi:hypothetical protein